MIVLNVPFSAASSKSSMNAPDMVLEQYRQVHLNEFGFATKLDVVPVPVSTGSAEEMCHYMTEIIKKQDSSRKICILGGDHSITYPAFKAFAEKNQGAGLLILDAHPCCNTDEKTAVHDGFVKKLVAAGIIDKSRIVHFGIRSWTGAEKDFLDTNKMKYFMMKQVPLIGFTNVVDAITESVSQWPSLYLSISLDVVDPAFAPGTSHIEPGGLTSRQMIYLVQRLKLLKNLKMFDIVEVRPDKDLNGMTSKLAAKLISELG